MNTKALFTVIFLLIINIAFSKTDKITGQIVNGKTNQFMSNCNVTLFINDEIYDSKVSGNNGEFTFYRLDTGEYTLRIEKNNFTTEEYFVSISEPNSSTHSFKIYLNSSNPVIAKVEIKEYPQQSEYEYFLLNHLYKSYSNDTTIVFSSTSNCYWNEEHRLLYIGLMHINSKNGEIEISDNNQLLGVFEVLPDLENELAMEETPEQNKWLSALEKISEVAGKVAIPSSVGILKNK